MDYPTKKDDDAELKALKRCIVSDDEYQKHIGNVKGLGQSAWDAAKTLTFYAFWFVLLPMFIVWLLNQVD